MDRCPCVSAKHGAGVIAPCIYVAVQSKAFFGVPALVIARAAYAGNGTAFAIAVVWSCFALLGLYWAVAGYRATRTHYGLLNGFSLAYSAGVVAASWWLLQNVLTVPPAGDLLIESVRALAVAWLAANAVNIWLQLRGLFPGKLPLRTESFLLNMRAVIARQAVIDGLAQERDRLARDLERKPAGSSEAETVLKLPGVGRAVLAALHPDKFTSDAEKLLATQRFQTASAVLEKLGGRR